MSVGDAILETSICTLIEHKIQETVDASTIGIVTVLGPERYPT